MFALQNVLVTMGHDVCVVRCKELYEEPSVVTYCFRIIKKILLRPFGMHVDVFKEKRYNRNFPIYTQNIKCFIEKFIHSFFVREKFIVPENEFDAIVVGSDQVWRPVYFKKCYGTPISRMFLDYTKSWKIRRIAYAASFGVDFWEYNKKETKSCSRAARLFHAISVREASGVSLCKKNLNVDAELVLDPTLLLQAYDYERILKLKLVQNIYVTSYILDDSAEKEYLINVMKDRFQDLTYKRMEIQKSKEIKPLISVEDWIQTIANSKFVFTDSFHGCVFCIVFNVEFAVYANAERGNARFTSLLKMFGLEKRLISNDKELTKVLAAPIEWDNVNQIRNQWAKNSLAFLRNSLG